MKKVRFNDVIEYEPLKTDKQNHDNDYNNLNIFIAPTWVGWLIGIWFVVFLIVWILGLVRMGRCNGRQSWLWWCTIFIPLFVPVLGQLWGFVVGLIALIVLRNGRKLLNMQCKS